MMRICDTKWMLCVGRESLDKTPHYVSKKVAQQREQRHPDLLSV